MSTKTDYTVDRKFRLHTSADVPPQPGLRIDSVDPFPASGRSDGPQLGSQTVNLLLQFK